VPEDVDNAYDAYMRSGGTTTLLSTGPSDTGADLGSGIDRINPAGDHVVIKSFARLTSNDTDDQPDLYERSAGQTTLVSIGSSGPSPSRASLAPSGSRTTAPGSSSSQASR
jgi:hypothetical protein